MRDKLLDDELRKKYTQLDSQLDKCPSLYEIIQPEQYYEFKKYYSSDSSSQLDLAIDSFFDVTSYFKVIFKDREELEKGNKPIGPSKLKEATFLIVTPIGINSEGETIYLYRTYEITKADIDSDMISKEYRRRSSSKSLEKPIDKLNLLESMAFNRIKSIYSPLSGGLLPNGDRVTLSELKALFPDEDLSLEKLSIFNAITFDARTEPLAIKYVLSISNNKNNEPESNSDLAVIPQDEEIQLDSNSDLISDIDELDISSDILNQDEEIQVDEVDVADTLSDSDLSVGISSEDDKIAEDHFFSDPKKELEAAIRDLIKSGLAVKVSDEKATEDSSKIDLSPNLEFIEDLPVGELAENQDEKIPDIIERPVESGMIVSDEKATEDSSKIDLSPNLELVEDLPVGELVENQDEKIPDIIERPVESGMIVSDEKTTEDSSKIDLSPNLEFVEDLPVGELAENQDEKIPDIIEQLIKGGIATRVEDEKATEDSSKIDLSPNSESIVDLTDDEPKEPVKPDSLDLNSIISNLKNYAIPMQNEDVDQAQVVTHDIDSIPSIATNEFQFFTPDFDFTTGESQVYTSGLDCELIDNLGEDNYHIKIK